jgi:hypothetical protein
MTTHDHDEPGDDLVPYVLGQLDEPARRALDRRVAADPAFAAEVEAVRRVLDLLPQSVASAPPPALRARVLAAAAAAEGDARPAPVRVAARRPAILRYAWAPALAAAAALAVWFGADNARLRGEQARAAAMTTSEDPARALEREARILLQEPNVVVEFAMAGEGAGEGARGAVLLDLDAKRGAVVMKALPAPPAGHVYRLWAEVDSKPVYCGDLAFDGAGGVRAQLPIPVESYTSPVTSLFVTLEAADAPHVPAGPTLARGMPDAG